MSGHPRAVPTEGVGKRTTAHLNLTRSLADAWGLDEANVRLVAPDGRFLHRDTTRLTFIKADAWRGAPSEAGTLAERIGNGLRGVAGQ